MTDAEREARAAMENLLHRYAEIEPPNHDHPAIRRKFERDVQSDLEDLDAYRDAVRDATLAAARAMVEGKMRALAVPDPRDADRVTEAYAGKMAAYADVLMTLEEGA
jgi:hypothetical protein